MMNSTDIQFLLDHALAAEPIYCGPRSLDKADRLIEKGLVTVVFDYRTGQGSDAERTQRYQRHNAVSVRVSEAGVSAAVDWLVEHGQEERAQDLAAKTDPHRAERAQAAAEVALQLRQERPLA